MQTFIQWLEAQDLTKNLGPQIVKGVQSGVARGQTVPRAIKDAQVKAISQSADPTAATAAIQHAANQANPDVSADEKVKGMKKKMRKK